MQKKKPHGHAKGSAYPSGKKSRKAFITINAKYGRIYFSAFAVRTFHLMDTGFEIFEHTGSWYFKPSDAPQAGKLTSHYYAFYCVDLNLVNELIAFFSGGKSVRLTIEEAQRKASRYLLTKSDELPGKETADNPPGGPVSKAEIKLDFYRRTDFQGRVKTLEVIRAEQIVVNAKHAL